MLLRVPQESILCPLLFNTFVNSISYFIQKAYICNFTDSNSFNSIKDNFEEFKTNLKKNFKLLLVWLYENHMVLNPEKCDKSNK